MFHCHGFAQKNPQKPIQIENTGLILNTCANFKNLCENQMIKVIYIYWIDIIILPQYIWNTAKLALKSNYSINLNYFAHLMKARLKSIHKDSLQEAEQVKLFVILHSILFGLSFYNRKSWLIFIPDLQIFLSPPDHTFFHHIWQWR